MNDDLEEYLVGTTIIIVMVAFMSLIVFVGMNEEIGKQTTMQQNQITTLNTIGITVRETNRVGIDSYQLQTKIQDFTLFLILAQQNNTTEIYAVKPQLGYGGNLWFTKDGIALNYEIRR